MSNGLNLDQDQHSVSPDLGPELTFSKNYFRNTVRVSNGLNLDQDQRSVSPDLGPKFELFAKVINRPRQERVK